MKLITSSGLRISARIAAGALCLVAAGCRQDMHDQPRYKPLGYNTFYSDGRDSRPLPANTVARGALHTDVAFYQCKVNNADIDYFPIPVTTALMERGHQR